MNLKTVLHRVAQGCGVCLPLLLIVGLLIPGCAGKRSDMLSSLIKPKQDAGAPGVADGDASDDDSTALIAGADSQTDKSQLSAFTAEDIIEGPPKLRHRVRSWFTRTDDTLATGDPFLEEGTTPGQDGAGDASDERQAIASSDPRGREESFSTSQVTQTAGKESIDDVQPWWKTGGASQERTASAGSENSRVDELLASFQTTKPAQEQPANDEKPWWDAGSPDNPVASITSAQPAASAASARTPKTTFSGQFDSRLERLRAELRLGDESGADAGDAIADVDALDAVDELSAERSVAEQNGLPQQTQPTSAPNPTIAARGTGEQADPFATTSGSSEDLPIVAGNAGPHAMQGYPSLMTQPRRAMVEPDSSSDQTDFADIPSSVDARSRVEALMTDARQDWEAWRLDRAYETAVAAQNLAVREHVQFLDGEQRPQDLVRKIAAEIESDTFPVAASEPTQTLDPNPFRQTDELGIRSAGTPFGFEQLDRLANPWTTQDPAGANSGDLSDRALARTANSKETERTEPIASSQNSGVSLLPPDDDFPSDANAQDWSDADPRDIRLATHKFPQFSLSGDEQIREQMKGLSDEDNQALLQNIADQKSRVLKSKGIQWPELPAAQQPRGTAEASRGPIQVAQAPRFTLEDDIAIAVTPGSKGDAGTSASTGSLLGQFWRSQPIWFIGGLVLLIVALRLWPWPKKDQA